jgi:hypothetical protein
MVFGKMGFGEGAARGVGSWEYNGVYLFDKLLRFTYYFAYDPYDEKFFVNETNTGFIKCDVLIYYTGLGWR